MAIKITESIEKVTPAKKTITVNDILVDKLRLIDDSGDITQQVLEALPEGVDKVSFKIIIELPSEE
ncbi:hypothetical protein [uncultured Robinsoniella sp.]|uniref:hypothetical protein n=1 Tax=uncultured Robinsoniella sp. TaxID=904190 RepID=UPI00204B33A0|nr:MAG TPA: hypothetical protein [Caudoviricetes sp.]